MSIESREEKLRSLMCAGLDGDADAYRRLLVELSSRLRGYFRSRLLRFHRGAVEAEDLVQEVLMAVYTRRDTYDRSQLLMPPVEAAEIVSDAGTFAAPPGLAGLPRPPHPSMRDATVASEIA